MDETGVLGLLEELSILLEDAKPVFGKNNLRQVDVSAAFEIKKISAAVGLVCGFNNAAADVAEYGQILCFARNIL